MDTTADKPLTQKEVEAISSLEADQDWHNDAQSRLAYAEALLERISQDIETVPAQAREHAAELIDSAIEQLTRMARRFSSVHGSHQSTPIQRPNNHPSEPRR